MEMGMHQPKRILLVALTSAILAAPWCAARADTSLGTLGTDIENGATSVGHAVVNEVHHLEDTVAGPSIEINHFGDGTGYQPSLKVPLPKSACDHAAFTKGFKDTYLEQWDRFVSEKLSLYQDKSKLSPQNAAYQKNVALYKGRMIGISGNLGDGKGYHPVPNCSPFDSYQSGQNAALDRVTKDEKALVSMESGTP